MTSITLPPNLTAIDAYAFSGCTSLTEFVIPNGVTSLNGTFYGCINLESITIPNSVTSIGTSTFNDVKENCELIFNTSQTTISKSGTNPFPQNSYKVKFTGTKIPTQDSTTSLFNADSNLKEVTIANTVTAIPASAFKNCTGLSNGNITIPTSVTSIGTGAFDDIGNGLTLTFAGTGNQTLTAFDYPNNQHKVVLGHGVPTNSSNASIFQNDTYLTEVVYAGGPNLIANAFTGCSNLTTVTFTSYPTTIQTTPLPDNVGTIIFAPKNEMLIHDVSSLFNSSSGSVTFQFKNSADVGSLPPMITIRSDAFLGFGTSSSYQFDSAPDYYIYYESSSCFPAGSTGTSGGTNYAWNSSTGAWQ